MANCAIQTVPPLLPRAFSDKIAQFADLKAVESRAEGVVNEAQIHRFVLVYPNKLVQAASAIKTLVR